MDFIKLYLKFIKVYIKSKIEYRFGLIFELFANIILFLVYFMGVYVIFSQFTNVHGWDRYEFIFMFTTNWISYSFSSFLFWKPMQDMGNMITTGEFDSYLIRPIGPLKYLVFRQFQYTFLPRMVIAIVFWIYSIPKITIVWSLSKIIFLVATFVMGFLIYTSVFVILGALSFWLLRSNEVTAIVINNDYGLRTFADYPLAMYSKPVQLLLTFIIPFGFTGYYTVAYLLEKDSGLFLQKMTPILAPIITIVFVILAAKLWAAGIKRYSSAGN